MERLLVFVPLLLACGPPRLANDGGTTTSQSNTESSGNTDDESESDDSESGDSTSTGEVFVPAMDYFECSCACDPYEQNCPEGEKCVPYGSTGGSFDAHKCVLVLGDQMPGEPCTYHGVVEATDDCDATSLCWDVMDVMGQPIGTCVPFCLGSEEDPQCPDLPGCRTTTCLVDSSATINLCLPTCDPLAQDCGPGLACFWANDQFNCVFTTADLPVGEVCDFINDCVAGSGCVEAGLLPSCAGESCCTPFCDPAADTDPCPELLAGTSCVPFQEASAEMPDCMVGRCLAP